MSEIFSHSAFLPVCISFLGGIFLTTFFFSVRLSSLRAATIEQEKAAIKMTEALKEERSALKDELAMVRTSESQLVKRQGELEAIARSEQGRRMDEGELIKQTESTLQDGFIRLENMVLNAVRKSQPREEITDFVPLAQQPVKAPAETPREENFEGFVMEPPIGKAESAANTLRAALTPPKS